MAVETKCDQLNKNISSSQFFHIHPAMVARGFTIKLRVSLHTFILPFRPATSLGRKCSDILLSVEAKPSIALIGPTL